MKNPPPMPALLLIEPQFVLRRTIVAVAHDLGIACFQEATGHEAALPLLVSRRFDGVVVDFSGAAAGFDLLSRLRQGAFASDPGVAVVAMTSAASEHGAWLRSLGSLSTLGRPFKVAELLQQLQQLTCGSAAQGQAA